MAGLMAKIQRYYDWDRHWERRGRERPGRGCVERCMAGTGGARTSGDRIGGARRG